MRYFYVICPVGADPDFAEKKRILENLACECGMDPFFPLERHRRFSLREVKADTQGAEFALADLSFERPSCYFELGLAQATSVPISLLAATGTPIHQVGDAREADVAFYSNLDEYRTAASRILARYSGLPNVRRTTR